MIKSANFCDTGGALLATGLLPAAWLCYDSSLFRASSYSAVSSFSELDIDSVSSELLLSDS